MEPKAFWQKNAIYRVKIYNEQTRFDGQSYDPRNPEEIQTALKRVFGPDWNTRSEVYLSTLNLTKSISSRKSQINFKILKYDDAQGTLTLKAEVSKAGKQVRKEIQVKNFLTNNSNPAITQTEREQVKKLIESFRDTYQTTHTDKTIYGVNASSKKIATPEDLGIKDFWPSKQIETLGLTAQVLVKNRDFEKECLDCVVVVKSTNGYNLVREFTISGFRKTPQYAEVGTTDQKQVENPEGDQEQVDAKKLVDETLKKITEKPYQTTLKTTLPSEVGIAGIKNNYKSKVQLGISNELDARVPELDSEIKVEFELIRVDDQKGEIETNAKVSYGEYSQSAKVLITGYQTTEGRRISSEKDVDDIIKELSGELLTNQIDKTPSDLLELGEEFWKIGRLMVDNYFTKDDADYGDRAGQIKNVKLTHKSYTKFAFAEVPNDAKTTGIPYDKWW
ncbi:lipoprotein 17-related variable surface protein [Mycoplasma sp. ATU-Cv-508]|uniref:lipoprotein 17-related variable surface protein n=1 Tax=Mycoplasma sp. ATU-Cv-508 TaxID=2048001 RepID=UPI001375104D